jgi:uncharacterized membrane protein
VWTAQSISGHRGGVVVMVVLGGGGGHGGVCVVVVVVVVVAVVLGGHVSCMHTRACVRKNTSETVSTPRN